MEKTFKEIFFIVLITIIIVQHIGCTKDSDESTSIPIQISECSGGTETRFCDKGPYSVSSLTLDEATANFSDVPIDEATTKKKSIIYYPTDSSNNEAPLSEGLWPVIVFSHANNDTICQIYDRYKNLHTHWSSWGFIVISIDDTHLNCNPGTKENIQERSDHQLAVIEFITTLSQSSASQFYQKIDYNSIILAGHSRGGGASLVSALALEEQVIAVITLQGIELTSYGFGTPSINTPTLGISVSEDVDLNYPYVEPTEDLLTGPYSWITFFGGIHAYTGDTIPIEPDDVPLISQSHQQNLTEFFTTAFLDAFVGVINSKEETSRVPDRNSEILFSHKGSSIAREYISEKGAALRWNESAGTIIWIDTYNDSNSTINNLGGQNEFQNFEQSLHAYTYCQNSEECYYMYRKSQSLLLENGQGDSIYKTWLSSTGVPVLIALPARLQARIKGLDTNPEAQLEVLFYSGGTIYTIQITDEHMGPIALTNRYTQLDVNLQDIDASLSQISIEAIGVRLISGSLFIDDLRIIEK